MNHLEKAIKIALNAHRGRLDKADAPYILHPLRVMLQMDTEVEMITAILHDVVEDSDWTIEKLGKEGFPEEVLQAIDCLTRKPGELYHEFIDRVAMNPLARRVNLAELEDNMDLRRLRQASERDLQRLSNYRNAWANLRSADD